MSVLIWPDMKAQYTNIIQILYKQTLSRSVPLQQEHIWNMFWRSVKISKNHVLRLYST